MYEIHRLAYTPATFGAPSGHRWYVAFVEGGMVEGEELAVRAGRTFRTRREASAWIQGNK